MYQDLTKSAVSINSCDTMESGNHSKDGANPKSQKSRNAFTVNIFIFAVIIMLSFFAAGCDKDNEKDEPVTTVEEDKANIRASFDRTKKLIENFKNGSLYRFADQFIDYHEEYVEDGYYYYDYVGSGNGDYSFNYDTWEYEHTPGAGNYSYEWHSYDYYDDAISEFTERLVDKLGDAVDVDNIGDEGRFNYASLKGKYAWNSSNERWDKTSDNAFILLFPSSESKTANDCEAVLTEYEDMRCDIEGDDIYLPTKASISLKKDSETLFSTSLSASYSNYGIPKQITANVYAKPLKVDVSFVQESSAKFKADVNLEDETVAENNLILNCEATLSSGITQYTDLDDISLNILKFNIRQHELSIAGTIDLKTLNDLRNTAANINACSNFEVFYKTQKVGTLKVVELDDEKYLYIVYKDETQENTSIYYDSFIEDLETMFEKYLE
ncbi:MAG: hypothetical protein LBL13_06675 [Bacteroidales bacterium]|jgi:hypothetical protein|nr:hypothetical protein [Bacteroidales bacterium]